MFMATREEVVQDHALDRHGHHQGMLPQKSDDPAVPDTLAEQIEATP
jgi:hypothetical protein